MRRRAFFQACAAVAATCVAEPVEAARCATLTVTSVDYHAGTLTLSGEGFAPLRVDEYEFRERAVRRPGVGEVLALNVTHVENGIELAWEPA